MKLYPFELPENVHPMAWVFLGFGLDADVINAVAKHLFDDLGARIDESVSEVKLAWAVDWHRGVTDHRKVSVGDEIGELVSSTGAVTLVSGHLPPGTRLEKHTGRIVGACTAPGIYSATFRVGPRIKYDPLGTPGGPGDAGVWIPVDQPRAEVAGTPVPTSLGELSPRELDELIVQAQAAQRAKLAREADGGY